MITVMIYNILVAMKNWIIFTSLAMIASTTLACAPVVITAT